MIKSIKKLFTTTNKSTTNNELINRNQENSVSFITTKNNQPVIELNIQHLDDDNAQKFAEILFLLGNNYYQEDIINMLTDMSKREPERSDFITKVIGYWIHYVNLKNTTNEPCVSPLSFSKIVNNGKQT